MTEMQWRRYEEVVQFLLNEFAGHFGLERVEEKQKIVGLRSGRQIEIDGKGMKQGNTGFLLIECKRLSKKRVEAEKLEALAYRILDAGAEGGIIVSALGLQEGALKIAEGENIVRVQLTANSTENVYLLKFLEKVMYGVEANVRVSDAATSFVVRVDNPPPDA